MHDVAVIGAGLFGVYAAIEIAKTGQSVVLIEQDNDILTRASFVNQARLHTGLHYPRSFDTAQDCLTTYHEFRAQFEPAIRDFKHIYAVSTEGSLTTPEKFLSHAAQLGLKVKDINRHHELFLPSKTQLTLEVEEPSVDMNIVRQILLQKLKDSSVDIILNNRIESMHDIGSVFYLYDKKLKPVECKRLVLAAYSDINRLRQIIYLEKLPLKHEFCQVVLGKMEDASWNNLGITVVDGQFWSCMPFGLSDLHSVTSVTYTPMQEALTPVELDDTMKQDYMQIIDHMNEFMAVRPKFRYEKTLRTVKTVLAGVDLDDRRPTIIRKDLDERVVTILSGKLNTVVNLNKENW